MHGGWVRLALAGALLLAAAGCAREAAPPEAEVIPLTFRPIESTDIGWPKPRPGEWDETILETPIEGGTAYIYAILEDPENVYGAILIDGDEFAYGVGPVGGPMPAPDSEQASIAEMSLVGKRVVRFKGVYGANAPVTVYADAAGGDDPVLLTVNTGHATEVDLDGDGTEEVVSEHGTPMTALVYRWDGARFQVADLNEALQADSVRYVAETGSFEAYSASTETTSEYRYEGDRMTPLPAE